MAKFHETGERCGNCRFALQIDAKQVECRGTFPSTHIQLVPVSMPAHQRIAMPNLPQANVKGLEPVRMTGFPLMRMTDRGCAEHEWGDKIGDWDDGAAASNGDGAEI